MNRDLPAPAGVERALQALLELVESDRARLCEEILGEARERARRLRAEASEGARRRIRQVFAEQRARRDERLAAAEAGLETQRRLHDQQRLSARLRLASEQLPQALQALWRDEVARAAWTGAVLAAARQRLPAGPWRIAHPADWPEDERQRALDGVASGSAPTLEVDPGIAAGLRVASGGIVLDGTLEGLLAERNEFEARLVQRLEGAEA